MIRGTEEKNIVTPCDTRSESQTNQNPFTTQHSFTNPVKVAFKKWRNRQEDSEKLRNNFQIASLSDSDEETGEEKTTKNLCVAQHTGADSQNQEYIRGGDPPS